MSSASPRKVQIAPSILSADFVRLAEECEAVLAAGADLLHVDVMDGHYVPNLTIGLPVVRALRRAFPQVTLDVHLMIDNPDDFVVAYVEEGADIVSFHPEVSRHPHRTVQRIRDAGARASLAINPGTSLSMMEWLAQDLDMVLIMSVNPGFGGQKFIGSSVEKIKQLKRLLEEKGCADRVDVEVDGGVSAQNIATLRDAGANLFVAGSAIFGADSYAEAIRGMRQALGEG